VIGDLEKRIQERLKSALETASVEITDKRIKKIDEKLNDVELEIKELKKAAETVAGYDRQFNLMNTEVEKTKAVVESAKEARNRMDDKMQRITDSFAEIRSMVYQREAKSKEQEVVLDKLKDTIAQVDTARILKEFTTRDEQLRDVNTRIEKLERGLKMLSETMNKIKGLMTDVGSLENVLKASKHAGEKLERIQEIEERIRAVSSRLDSTYVDMKKRLDEFAAYRVKQDRLDGMGNDLIKNVEEITRRLADFSTKDDLDVVKKTIDKLKDQVKAAAEGPALPPDLRRLQEEKEDIEALLSTLEENLRNKEITQDEYNKTRSMNLERIKEIEEKIQAYTTKHTAAEKKEEPEPAGAEGGKHKKSMLLAKLRESYESGEISRAAYEKSKKLLLKK
jgi:DNA repair exonuclease SbcCD ATPase subunit